jgi:hypothetical protein
VSAREPMKELGETVYRAALEAARERNLDLFNERGVAVFLGRHQDEWNEFVDKELLPVLDTRATAEAADLMSKIQNGTWGNAIAPEEKEATIAAVREQLDDLVKAGRQFFRLTDEQAKAANEEWANLQRVPWLHKKDS